MKILLVFALVVLAAVCQGFLVPPTPKHECHDNSGCPSTKCCVSDLHGHYCANYQNSTDPCHRPGHHRFVYKCGCALGLICAHIHIDPGHFHPSGDPLATIDQAIEAAGLGRCAMPQTTTSTMPPT